MENKKRSFFERLTGSVSAEDETPTTKRDYSSKGVKVVSDKKDQDNDWIEEENEEAELSVDVYQTPTDIIIQTMVAGVKPDDLEISVS